MAKILLIANSTDMERPDERFASRQVGKEVLYFEVQQSVIGGESSIGRAAEKSLVQALWSCSKTAPSFPGGPCGLDTSDRPMRF
jgi:hypothetical protein